SPFALIDVREAGEYNSSHIPGASPIARRHLEFLMPHAVPFAGTPVVLCDDDGRRAELAAATVERMGYRDASVLDGGVNRWVTDGFPTEWGTNVPSKDFGEKVEVVHHVPEMEAKELAERMRKGEKFVILDTRTPEEYAAGHIPGFRWFPGGQAVQRSDEVAVVKNCPIVFSCDGKARATVIASW